MFRILHDTSRNKQVAANLRELAAIRKINVNNLIRKEAEILVEDLKDSTPALTGAAANDLSRARKEATPSHPAIKKGLTVGLNSGWMLRFRAGTTKQLGGFAISNPMWNPYLRLFDYGILESAEFGNISGFVRRAWNRCKDRIEDKLNTARTKRGEQ